MKNSVRLSVALAFGLGATLPPFAFAQQAAAPEQVLEKVEITGSIIKRIEAEGALPVQVITRAQIDKLGVTSANELIQQLPAMQGFTAESTSVNGGGGGVTTASIHDLGAAYTLVLLNGQRVAAAGTGTSVNLETLPLSAIERVEVLTDGASAVYGSDAIAGVVNFITKKNTTDGSFNVEYDRPIHKGGSGGTFSLSKGFGDLERDGWNIVATIAHDEQTEINALDRSFSRTGRIKYTDTNGQVYSLSQSSINSVPANLSLIYGTDPANPTSSKTFSFYKAVNGSCPAPAFSSGSQCRFDYPAYVEDVSPSRRSSAYVDGHFKINDKLSAFADLVFSQYDMIPRYAPPAQPLTIYLNPAYATAIGANPISTPAYTGTVVPALTTTLASLGINPAQVSEADIYLRVFDAGGRTDDYRTTTEHMAFGLDGNAGGFDYKATWVHSYTSYEDILRGGYVDNNKFNDLIATGAFNPLTSAAGSGSALASAILYNRFDWQRTFLDTLSLQGSHDLFSLPGGASVVGVGAEYDHVRQTDDPSQLAQGAWAGNPGYTDSVIGGGSGYRPYVATRNNYGVFAELELPIVKMLDVTASLRYDGYDKVKNSYSIDSNGNPAGAAEQGISSNKATGKVSFRLQPVKEVLVRGSYGTGFRAPRVFDVANPLSFAGNTAGTYVCPFPTTDPLSRGCTPNNPAGQQFDVVAGGNASSGSQALKPETSKQYTAGVRIEPISSLSVGADFWDVKIKNKIEAGGIPEATAFANPNTYRSLFNVIIDPISGGPVLALTESPLNLTEAQYQGVDYDINFKMQTGMGRITADFTATHLMKSQYQIPGLSGWQTSMSQYGPDQNVAFRNVGRLAVSIDREGWKHTVVANYKTGYLDQGGFEVPSYTLWDWQSVYHATKSLDVTAGIKNVFDTRPPVSFVIAGGGNQVGYDGRYTDPTLRSWYVRIRYSF